MHSRFLFNMIPVTTVLVLVYMYNAVFYKVIIKTAKSDWQTKLGYLRAKCIGQFAKCIGQFAKCIGQFAKWIGQIRQCISSIHVLQSAFYSHFVNGSSFFSTALPALFEGLPKYVRSNLLSSGFERQSGKRSWPSICRW